MKKYGLSMTALAVLALSACVKDPDMEMKNPVSGGNREMTLSVSGTSAASVAVLDKNGIHEFRSAPLLDKSAYVGYASDADKYLVLAPYTEKVEYSGGTFNVAFPGIRTLQAGVVSPESDFASGIAAGGFADLSPLVSFLSFDVTGTNITSIAVRGTKGEKVAGGARIDFDAEGKASISNDSGKSEFCLNLLPSADSFGEGRYIVPVAPADFSGFDIEVCRSDDDRISLMSAPSAKMLVGDTLNLASFVSSDMLWEKVTVLRFLESDLFSEASWPFKEKFNGSGTYTTTSGNHALSILGSNQVLLGKSGFAFGNAAGDYIEFPAYEGLALNKVIAVCGNDGTNAGNPAIVTADGAVLSEAWNGNKSNGDRHEWAFKGIHNKVCRLQLTADAGDAGCVVKQLFFFYRNAADVEYSVDATQTGSCSIKPGAGNMNVTLNGSYTTSVHGESNYKAGFEYKKDGADTWTSVECPMASENFSLELSGLEYGKYSYRAWAVGNVDVSKVYGEEKTFSDVIEIVLDFNRETSNPAPMEKLWKIVVNPTDSNVAPQVIEGDVDGYHFKFATTCSFGIGLRTSSGRSGLSFSRSLTVATPGYCQFPAIEDFSLSGMDIKFLDKNNTWTVSPGVDGGMEATGTALASNPASLAARTLYSCKIEGAAPSTSYYFCTAYQNCTIMTLTVKYELQK